MVGILPLQWISAIECYHSPQSSVSRVFPIFFGKREDAFGKIGNLFLEDEYTNLPDVVPEASIQLATTLLRANGVEPRPQVMSITIKEVITQMKKFLCVFAWNIKSPELITSESSNQLLMVLRNCLADEKTILGPLSHQQLNPPPPDSQLSHADKAHPLDKNHSTPPVPPLRRCIEILQENFGIESSVAPQVVKETLDALADDAITSKCDALQSLVAKAQYLVGDVLGITE